MREWLNRAASKAVELLVSSEGSNPSLSDRRGEFERVRTRFDKTGSNARSIAPVSTLGPGVTKHDVS